MLLIRLLVPLLANSLVNAFSLPLKSFDNVVLFGDSFSDNGYNSAHLLEQPDIGSTTSGGRIWAQYMMESLSSKALLFDFARAGATINQTLVSVDAMSFEDQVKEFKKYWPNEQAKLDSQSTLYIIFIGINDVGFPVMRNNPFDPTLLPAQLSTFSIMLETLYSSNARNFLVIGIPPMYRTPTFKVLGPDPAKELKTRTDAFNSAVWDLSTNFGRAKNTSVLVYDTTALFNRILDSLSQYGFDSDTFCPEYAQLRTAPESKIPACKYPMSRYFWMDEYHPTYPVHKLLSDDIVHTIELDAGKTRHRTRSHHLGDH